TNNVDASMTLSSLWYAGGQAAASGSIFTTTQIPTGGTLTISNTGTGNTVLVGTEQTADNTVLTSAPITGAGTLAVNNSQGVFTVRQGAAANGTQKATLDMSGLANFTATLNEFQVGVGSSSVGGRATGTVLLASNNTITANTIRDGWENSANG